MATKPMSRKVELRQKVEQVLHNIRYGYSLKDCYCGSLVGSCGYCRVAINAATDRIMRLIAQEKKKVKGQ